MAKDEQDVPGIPVPYRAEPRSQRLSERMAHVDGAETADFTRPEDASQSVAFRHLHDGHVFRSAGRMVIGARAPMPGPVSANGTSGAFEQSQLFSSSKDGRQRGISGGAAVALACAVAVGSTAVLTSALNTTIEHDSSAKNTGRGKTVAASAGGQVSSRAVMAASATQPQATQVASLSPVAMPQSITSAAGSGIIRIAKQDAPGLVVEDISGRPGSEIPLRIEIAQSDTEEYSFLMFRGLPAEISLSAGFRLKDSWAVSLRDMANLSLVSPANYEARFQVEVLLIKGRNTPADSRVMNVSLQRATPNAAPPPVAVAPRQESAPQRILTAAPPEPQPSPPQVTKIETAKPSLAPAQPKKLTISVETETAMLERATQMLSMGDVSSARLLFEHVAKKGSGRAAMALARTFDPAYFSSINTRGLKPDRDKAKEWYAVAAELGQDEARSRLGALSAK
jgi:hypothetical protein